MPQYQAPIARVSFFALMLVGLFALLVSGCGGGSSDSKVTSFAVGFVDFNTGVFNPLTNQSVQQGQAFTLSTQAMNSKSVVIFPTVTWSSSNPQIASVSTSGDVCGGTWDANFVNCTPGPSGSATITATAAGGLTSAITVDVHARISRVTITPASNAACLSQTQTLQFTATAFDASGNPVASPGPPSFSAADTSVATVDANGLVTAKNSGATNIFGDLAGITSAPATFVTCPPKSIVLHQSGDPAGTVTTNFTPAIGGSVALVADVADTLSNPVTGLTLTIASSQPAGVSVNGTTLTASDNTFATVTASCLPPGCNPGTGANVPGTGQAIYSNMVTVTVTGTALNTTAYVTGATAADGTATNTSLIPIDTSTNTAGTAITLPGVPNSLAISPKGDTLYAGTSNGLGVIATAANTVTNVSNAPGSILAVSPAGTQVVLNDAANHRVLLYDASGSSAVVVPIETSVAANSASFSPDGYKLFIGTSSGVFEFTAALPTHLTPFPTNVTGIAAIPQGVLAYASPTLSGQLSSIATCNNAVLSNPSVTPAPSLIHAAANGTELIGIGTSWITLPYTIGNTLCPATVPSVPPVVTEGSPTAPTYSGPVPTQLIVSPTNNFAIVTSNNTAPVSNLNLLNLANGTPVTAPLAAGTGTLTTGGITLDGTKLYVGLKGGTAGNAVHLFDLTQATPADTKQITTTFTPDFVVVKP